MREIEKIKLEKWKKQRKFLKVDGKKESGCFLKMIGVM
jgi:hypothetical protein